jgi:tetratricopeptide (TPR) repeat protein
VTNKSDSLLALVREARPHIVNVDPETEIWLDRLEARHDDLHHLVERSLESDSEAASELAAALWVFWWQRGHMAEGRGFLERAQAIEGPDREQVLKGLGTIAFRQGDAGEARLAFAARSRMAEARGDQRAIGDSFADLARVALRLGDFKAVRAHAERGYAAAERLEPSAIRMPLHMMAAAARMEGRLDEARALYLRSRELNERLGKEETVVGEDHNLGHVALHAGDREEAARRFRASREWIFSHDNAYLAPYAYLDAGVLALHDGELDRAICLVAKAHVIFVDTDSVPDPDDQVELDGAVTRLKQELGPRFDELWSQGAALSPAEARTLAQLTT